MRADHVDARHGHQPPQLGRLERLAGDLPLDRSDLWVEELDVAQARRDRLCLLERQLERAQPRAPLDAEQIRTGARPTSRRTSAAWISFFAREWARTSCSRRASRRRNTRVCSSGDHTVSSSPAASSRASARAFNLSSSPWPDEYRYTERGAVKSRGRLPIPAAVWFPEGVSPIFLGPGEADQTRWWRRPAWRRRSARCMNGQICEALCVSSALALHRFRCPPWLGRRCRCA
jgi:hypothetical protein